MSNKKSKKIYLVVKGRQPGLYTEWFGPGGAAEQVKDFPDAVYKGFYTREAAVQWLQPARPPDPRRPSPLPAPAARVRSSPSLCRGRRASLPCCAPAQPCSSPMAAPSPTPVPAATASCCVYKDLRRELSGGFRLTTNNRMELLACIAGLSALESPADAVLFSDSSYVVDGITKGWAKRWQSRGWLRTKTEKAENIDLWERLLALCAARKVDFRWVRGHAGDPDNERCDRLATQAASRKNLPPDENFERGQTRLTPLPLFDRPPTGKTKPPDK